MPAPTATAAATTAATATATATPTTRDKQSSKPRMAISKALAELLAMQGNVDEARQVLQEALDRQAAAASNPPVGPRWIGPGRRAKPSAEDVDREDEDSGPAELLLAWANVEESVSVLLFFLPFSFGVLTNSASRHWGAACRWYRKRKKLNVGVTAAAAAAAATAAATAG